MAPGFVPRVPFVTAEEHVDFEGLNRHIVLRRARIEKQVQPAVNRLAFLVFHLGMVPLGAVFDLRDAFAAALETTVRVGYRDARREITELRAGSESPPSRVLAAYALPDAGDYSHAAAGGLSGVQELVKKRAHDASEQIAKAANEAGASSGLTSEEREALIAAAARKTAHLVVLELVGETMNLARTAGALSLARPPQFAMRSEQLDKTTCDPCSREHGEIYELDSSDFYAHTPPSYCLGGGRCRGIWVYGDERVQVMRPAAR